MNRVWARRGCGRALSLGTTSFGVDSVCCFRVNWVPPGGGQAVTHDLVLSSIFYSWLPSLIEGRNTGVEHGGIISCLRCREERGAACVHLAATKKKASTLVGGGFGNHQGFVCYHLQLCNYVWVGKHVFCLAICRSSVFCFVPRLRPSKSCATTVVFCFVLQQYGGMWRFILTASARLA